jgi:hypothetical protein
MAFNEIYHHGVKGQQWGVKHGPPYPIDKSKSRVTIKKGTAIKRLSGRDESIATGHAYVNYNKSDIKRYKGFFAVSLKNRYGRKAPIYEVSLEAAEDLVSPSKKERVETFIDLYKNDVRIGQELGSYHKDDWHHFTPLPKKYYEKKLSSLKEDELRTKGWDHFRKALGGNQYIQGKYFEALAKKGYNFCYDDEDGGVYGKEPSIIFDRTKSLNYKGQTKLDDKEIYKTWRKYGSKLRKGG